MEEAKNVKKESDRNCTDGHSLDGGSKDVTLKPGHSVGHGASFLPIKAAR